MDKPFICFIESAQGVGKSTVVKALREVLPHTTSMDLTGCPDKSVKGEDKQFRYHSKILQLMEETRNIGMNWLCSRSYMSESVYCSLGAKPYNFKLNAYFLRQELEFLTQDFDIYFVLLTATDEQLEERLKRNKFEYNPFSVENSLKQQEKYKEEMMLLAKECENVKVFEMENNDIQKTVDTIKDLILSGMIG